MSVMLYNKDLYTKAGLDPEKPPTTLKEFADQAARDRQARRRHQRHLLRRQLRRLHTCSPSGPRSGRPAATCINAEGTEATLDSRRDGGGVRALPGALRRGRRGAGVQGRGRARPGSARCRAARSASRPGRRSGSALIEEKGVQDRRRADPRPRRRRVHVRRRRRDRHRRHQQARRRRRGTSWPGPCRDEAQVEVIAKNKGVPTRTDLADNKYSAADPRIVTINNLVAKGKTPYAMNFNADLQRPAEPVAGDRCRGALFGDAAKVAQRAQHRHHRVPASRAESAGRQCPRTAGPTDGGSDDRRGARRPPACRRRGPRRAGRAALLRRADRARWSACSSSSRWGWSCGCRCTTGRCSARRRSTRPENYTRSPTTPLLSRGLVHAEVHGRSSPSCCSRSPSGWRCWCRSRRRGRRASSAPPSSCPPRSASPAPSLLFLGLLSDEIGPVNDMLRRRPGRRLRLVDQRQPEHRARLRRSCWCCGASPGSTC